MDPDASNLPLDVQNTVITPSTPLVTRAGVSVSFGIELRTINPKMRRNMWYSDPASKIKL
jgi:hypothetical protein